jgi:hypothetical protein
MSAQIQFRVDAESFDKWGNRIKREAPEVFDELLVQSGDLIAKTMKEKAPVKSGFLRESITARKGQGQVEVGPTAKYAPFVEFGTKPHIIEPVSASVLAFEIDGTTVFAKRVMHPGFSGRFFVRETKDECLPQIQSLAREMYELLFMEAG